MLSDTTPEAEQWYSLSCSRNKAPIFSNRTSKRTVFQELKQERFIYRATVADNFQIIKPILQTIRSSCEVRAEVLIIDVRLDLRIHKLYGSMMYLDLTDVLEAFLMRIDLNAKIQVSVACKRWCCKSILGLDNMN
jgi:hypothetical protein